MFLNIISIPNNQRQAIQVFADANNLEITKRSETSRVEVMEFDWTILPDLLQAVPELKQRMWLFNSSEDVISCSVSYDSEKDNVNIAIEYFEPSGSTATIEKTIPEKAFEIMLENADLAEFEGGEMVREVETNRDWSGEVDHETQSWSVSGWVDVFGYDTRTCEKLFPAMVAMWHEEMKERAEI